MAKIWQFMAILPTFYRIAMRVNASHIMSYVYYMAIWQFSSCF